MASRPFVPSGVANIGHDGNMVNRSGCRRRVARHLLLFARSFFPRTEIEKCGTDAGDDHRHDAATRRDASIHPGAVEIRGDGVDQDCNGYDLTIRVHYAVYSHDGSGLRVRASSSLGDKADLQIDGVGALKWRAPYHDWVFDGSAGEARPRLIVRGVEGEVSVPVRRPTKRSANTGGTP